MLKRKKNHDNPEIGILSDYNQGFHRKALDEDTSNRSSSGSAVSNSESCAQFGSAEASDLTGRFFTYAGLANRNIKLHSLSHKLPTLFTYKNKTAKSLLLLPKGLFSVTLKAILFDRS